MWVLGDPKKRFADVRARGGKIVLVDPRRTETAAWCTSHHFIRPGGDAALLLALIHVVFDEGLQSIDHDVATRVDELYAICKEFPPERVAGPIGPMSAAAAGNITPPSRSKCPVTMLSASTSHDATGPNSF